MSEEKKVRKNPNPLVVKGIFYVTADFEDKQYVVSNGLSFIRFASEDDDIKKGDYISVHGPVYQKKGSANPIITGEAIVKKLSEKEVEDYKASMTKLFEDKPTTKKKVEAKKCEKCGKTKCTCKESKADKKLPWE